MKCSAPALDSPLVEQYSSHPCHGLTVAVYNSLSLDIELSHVTCCSNGLSAYIA